MDAAVRDEHPGRALAASVSVVIPTLNEAESLPWVLERLPRWVDEVVLVDGLSTDGTHAVGLRLRPDATLVHQHRPGKGAALRAGFAAATGDIVVMLDADGSTDPRELDRFVAALVDGADFVKGSRYIAGGGSTDITRLRSNGNRTLVRLVNMRYGSRFTDLCYGYCAFWRCHLDALAVTADGFEIETQLVLAALAAGLEIREVPSFELLRRAGVSNLNARRDGIRVLRTTLARDAGRRWHAPFDLRPVDMPLWPADRVPASGERRRLERRRTDAAASRYTGPERRRGERRETAGTVAAYRAVYAPPARKRDARPARLPVAVGGAPTPPGRRRSEIRMRWPGGDGARSSRPDA
jgi:hypothetical protein